MSLIIKYYYIEFKYNKVELWTQFSTVYVIKGINLIYKSQVGTSVCYLMIIIIMYTDAIM